MNWAEIKQQARDAVHETFSVPAFYTFGAISNLEIKARLQRKSAYLGDDYDEFSPGLFSEINRVIIDLREVVPERGAKLVFPDFNGIEVFIESYIKQGEHKVLCEVRL